MSDPNLTCWTLIEAAAEGRAFEREEFARRYGPVIESYLGKRWGRSRLRQEIPDAVQELFVECFRSGGVLEKVDRGKANGFRGFLYGAARNIARRFEQRQATAKVHPGGSAFDPGTIESDESTLSQVFDRAWARSILAEALGILHERAHHDGEEALRRLELLRLRTHEGVPIRDIAARWNCEAQPLHDQYARVRKDFHRALTEVVSFHHPGSASEIERECRALLELVR